MISKAQSWTNNDRKGFSTIYNIFTYIWITGPNLDDHNEVNDDADNAASITSLHLPSIILIYLASSSWSSWHLTWSIWPLIQPDMKSNEAWRKLWGVVLSKVRRWISCSIRVSTMIKENSCITTTSFLFKLKLDVLMFLCGCSTPIQCNELFNV